MSGWVIARQQPSTAVWGGVTGGPNAPATGQFASGWAVYRTRPSTVVWGGVTGAFPAAVPSGALVTGDYDGKSWWKKRWILRL